MPEIKHQFTGGKMNKDLDERLVPNGEYRDAMNVQVATSEGSGVGTVQNILGNSAVGSSFTDASGVSNLIKLGADAECVGSIADEKIDLLYWFVWTSDTNYIFSHSRNGNLKIVFIDKKGILNFSKDNVITGINVIDDMLLWTDNTSEPKKINVKRCAVGSIYPDHTRLINEANDTTYGDGVDLEEKHITVIKKTPAVPLEMVMKTSRNPDLIYTGVIDVGNDDGGINNTSFTAPSQFNFNGISPLSPPFTFSIDQGINAQGDLINIGPVNYFGTQVITAAIPATGNTPAVPATYSKGLTGWHKLNPSGGQANIPVGTKIVLKPFDDDGTPPGLPLTDFVVKGFVVDYDLNTANTTPYNGIKMQVTNVDGIAPTPDASAGETVVKYVVDLFDESERIFEFKYPRFSYRYKYEDGEYSPFAPFTQVAFVPGSFDYHPRKGYNIGMTNRLKHVELGRFINDQTPDDVVSVDLLFKDESSTTVYIVDTLRSDEESASGTLNAWDTVKSEGGFFKIDKETVNSVVPSNQLLRPWDNVPRRALAQDITGNRVVYGNYVQNFDVKTVNNQEHHVDFSLDWTQFPKPSTEVGKSIKSLREYQLGVVFIDEYGRETPVISNPSGTMPALSKIKADQNNRIQANLIGSPPVGELTHFKWFVKETANEYYNLAMDRWYDAEDSTVWLAFPSTERNKLDIDTFLILKKGSDQDTLVAEAARYRILAIESEAPDFIKTKKTLVSSQKHYYSSTSSTGLTLPGNPIFDTVIDNAPATGVTEFQLLFNSYNSTPGRDLHNYDKGHLYIEFGKAGEDELSQRYKIASMQCTYEANSTTLLLDTYNIQLESPLGDDVNFITDDPLGLSPTQIEDGAIVNIYKYEVDNLPQFDGRFFVKIYKDDVFENNIQKTLEQGEGMRITQSKKVYSLRENMIQQMTQDMNNWFLYDHHYNDTYKWGNNTPVVFYSNGSQGGGIEGYGYSQQLNLNVGEILPSLGPNAAGPDGGNPHTTPATNSGGGSFSIAAVTGPGTPPGILSTGFGTGYVDRNYVGTINRDADYIWPDLQYPPVQNTATYGSNSTDYFIGKAKRGQGVGNPSAYLVGRSQNHKQQDQFSYGGSLRVGARQLNHGYYENDKFCANSLYFRRYLPKHIYAGPNYVDVYDSLNQGVASAAIDDFLDHPFRVVSSYVGGDKRDPDNWRAVDGREMTNGTTSGFKKDRNQPGGGSIEFVKANDDPAITLNGETTKATETWFIDEGLVAGHRSTSDTAGLNVTGAATHLISEHQSNMSSSSLNYFGPRGMYEVNADSFKMDLGFGGIEMDLVGNGGIDERAERWVEEHGFSIGLWNTADGNPKYNGGSYTGWVGKLNPGFQWRWREDPTKTIYTFTSNISVARFLRHGTRAYSSWDSYTAAGPGSSLGYSYLATSGPNLAQTMATFLSQNWTKNWRLQSTPGIEWDPWANNSFPAPGKISNGYDFNLTQCSSSGEEDSTTAINDCFLMGNIGAYDQDAVSTCMYVKSLAGVDSVYGISKLHVGMALKSYERNITGVLSHVRYPILPMQQGGGNLSYSGVNPGSIDYTDGIVPIKDISSTNEYWVVSEITPLPSASSPTHYKLELSGYNSPLLLDDQQNFTATNFPTFPPVTNVTSHHAKPGGTARFVQVRMNGHNANTEFNINYCGHHNRAQIPMGAGGSLSPTGFMGAVGYNFDIVEKVQQEETLSENPAVWETEPKESKDLDIYYEASGAIPMVINIENIHEAIPVGSIIKGAVSTSTNNLGGIVVVDGYFKNGAQIGLVFDSEATFAPNTWDVIRPDGLEVTVALSSALTPSGVTVSEAEIMEKILYRSFFKLPWHNCFSFGNGVESNRIRDNYNLPFVLNGVKASTTFEDEYKEEHRRYGLIYSGIFNSTSGLNNLNQFIQAEKITKDVNPRYGSIQKLHARDGDLVTLCEDKCLRILSNKDALYNADGNTQLTATENVLGQTIPFSGEFGISTDPESFASESYRVYFADRVRGAIMRLSKDGLTPISDAGMKDWFRDNLKLSNKLIGSYDDRNDEYNITLKTVEESLPIGIIGENSAITSTQS